MTTLELWDFKSADTALVNKIADRFKVSKDIARILAIRNIGSGDFGGIQDFLFPPKGLLSSSDTITDPDQLKKALERLKKAITNGEPIMINGDPDADGITGTVVIAAALRHLGADVHYDFPVRSREGHGLQPRIIEKAKKLKCSIIMTTDCGSKDIVATDYATSLGLDVIICDHHILGRKLPRAYAMINPYLVKEKTQDQKLAGAGVSYKVMNALFEYMNAEMPGEFRQFLLACATLGTLSDRMSLMEPINRSLIQKGVKAVNNTPMEGLKALRGLAPDTVRLFSPRAVSLYLVPPINAPGRIGDPSIGIPDSNVVVDLLLLGQGKQALKKANSLIKKFMEVVQLEKDLKREGKSPESTLFEVEKVNDERKKITSTIENEVETAIQKMGDLSKERIIIVKGHNWNPGVIGINADRLRERFLKPGMILTTSPGSDYVRGSCRSIPTINIYGMIDKVANQYEEDTGKRMFEMEVKTELGTKTIHAFGGHNQACGFTVHKDKLDIFLKRLKDLVEELPRNSFQYRYEVMDTLTLDQLNTDFLKGLAKVEPFGQAFDFPIYCVNNCEFGTRTRPFGNKYQTARTPHVEFEILRPRKVGNKARIERVKCVGFGLWEKYQAMVKKDSGAKYNIICTLEKELRPRRRSKKGGSVEDQIRLNVIDIRKPRRKPAKRNSD